jgi:peptidoglycan hydrolase-like protein with peptidoglycan-binding domain
MLNGTGHFNIAEDGIFGPNTESAVTSFQQKAGIAVDGVAGNQTYKALLTYGKGSGSSGSSSGNEKIENWMGQLLRKGDSGPMVRDLQEMLTKARYSPGTIDGVFGDQTYNALIEYQKSAKIKVDGIAGRQTYKSLTKKEPWKENTSIEPIGTITLKIDNKNPEKPLFTFTAKGGAGIGGKINIFGIKVEAKGSVQNYLSSNALNDAGKVLELVLQIDLFNQVSSGFSYQREITDENKIQVDYSIALLDIQGKKIGGKGTVSTDKDFKISIGGGILIGVGGEFELQFNVSEAIRRLSEN